MLAVEAVMRRLVRNLGQDEEIWALAGLVHDVDLQIRSCSELGLTLEDFVQLGIEAMQEESEALGL